MRGDFPKPGIENVNARLFLFGVSLPVQTLNTENWGYQWKVTWFVSTVKKITIRDYLLVLSKRSERMEKRPSATSTNSGIS